MERVIAYIDGFNLYHGLKEKGWRHLYWLNVQKLARNLLRDYQQLVITKYFTAPISGPPAKRKRQSTFLEALETLPDFEILRGKYQANPEKCPDCGFEYRIPTEKMTDVQIGVEIVSDAFEDKFDVAPLISGDKDLTPAIKAVKERCLNKKIVVAFPPARSSSDLAKVADANFHISKSKLHQSVFPDQVKKADGYILQRPSSWV